MFLIIILVAAAAVVVDGGECQLRTLGSLPSGKNDDTQSRSR